MPPTGEPACKALEDLPSHAGAGRSHELEEGFAVEIEAALRAGAIDHLGLHGHHRGRGQGLREQFQRAADDGGAQDHNIGLPGLRWRW